MHAIKQRRHTVYFFAIFASILLSCWQSLREVVINPDAICYLQSAQSMVLGLHTATHLCEQAHWPFYSILIFAVASLTKISFLYSAYLLDGFFTVISVIAFINIVRFFKDTSRVMWLAAFVILLSHEFNAIREYIIRDHGFWAFYLISIWCLLLFVRKPQWIYALTWSVSLIIATLFRIEGMIFLLTLPFIAIFRIQPRFSAFLKLNAILFLSILALCIWLIKHPYPTTEQLGRIGELKFQLLHGLSIIGQHFKSNAQAISEHVLNRYSSHDGMLIFFLALTGWYVINIIQNVSFIYAGLVIFAWCRKLLPTEKKSSVVLWAYVFLNVLITAAFLAENMFLSKRYLMALSLTLMVWVPFTLDYLYQLKRKSLFMVAVLLIIIFSLGGIFNFGYSKKYLHDSGIWLEKNLPPQATLYSNDYQVMYYSHRFGNAIFTEARKFSDVKMIIDKKWKHYDYVALRINKSDLEKKSALCKELGTPIEIFANQRGDEVAIYKVNHK